jgi:hypothetical protein
MTRKEEAMEKARTLGHCPLHEDTPCPCKWETNMGECFYAGEVRIKADKWIKYNTKADYE